jgi:LuxR family maltose regulon positive regulatory protein
LFAREKSNEFDVTTGEHLRWGWPAQPARAAVSPKAAVLFDRWDVGTGCLLVEAPRGYGKSAQVMAWLAARASSEPVVWITGSNFINTWESTWNMLLDGMLDLGVITREVREGVTNLQQLFLVLQRLEQPVIVVYDDFDSFTPPRRFEAIESAARQFPMLRNILMTSEQVEDERSADPNRVTITRDDLKWTPELAREVLGPEITRSRLAARLDDVVSASGGRADAILSFFRDAHGVAAVDPLDEFQGTWLIERATIVDGSGRSALLLLHLAQFIEVPIDMLEDSGFPDAASLIAGLRREGLVYEHRSSFGAGQSVSISATDRTALADRSARMLTNGLPGLHRRSAHTFVRRGILSLAAFHYASAGEYTLATELLKRPLDDFEGEAGVTAARLAFAAMPMDRIADDLELLAIRVLASHLAPHVDLRSRGEAEARLLSAPAADIRQLPLLSRTLIAAAVVTTLLTRGRPAEAVTRGRQAAEELDGLAWEEMRSLGRGPGLLWTALAESELMSANIHRAIELSAVAREWNGELGHAYAAMRSCAVSAAAYAVDGDLARAQSSIDETVYVRDMQGWPDVALPATISLARLFIAFARVDATLAAQAQLEFQRIGRLDPAWRSTASVASAITLLCAGNGPEALAASRTALAETEAPNAPALIRHLAIVAHSDALASTGQAGGVLAFLDGVEEAPDHAFCYGARRANAALARGDAQAAIQATDDCVELSRTHVGGTLASALLRRSVATEMLGLTSAADATFSQAVGLLSTHPRVATFVNLNQELSQLWERLERVNPQLVAATRPLADEHGNTARDNSARPPAPLEPLSQRELQVLGQLTVKATYREIGGALFLSENTVKTHVSRVYRKLNVTSRREAVDLALRLGLVETGQ